MRKQLSILTISVAAIAGCPNAAQEAPIHERVVEIPEVTGAQVGCDADRFPRGSCFSMTISMAHSDMAEAVGNPQILRERLSVAKIASVSLNNGEREVSKLFFDSSGRLVRQEGEIRYEVEYGPGNLIRRIERFSAGDRWSNVTFAGGDSSCTIVTERFTKDLIETRRCRIDGNEVLREGPGAQKKVLLDEDEIVFDDGSLAKFDRLGRISERRSGGTFRFLYDDRATRSIEIRADGQEPVVTEWALDEHGLPLTMINHVASFRIDHVYEMRPE